MEKVREGSFPIPSVIRNGTGSEADRGDTY